jgi:N-acetylglucosaminyldiphosphoundecaprenol N-acetyl-beta-D-mannosaminyltransferase
MSKQDQFDKLELLGVDVDALGMDDAMAFIIDRAAPGEPSAYITKPYVEFMDKAYKNPELADLLNSADLSIPDGIALVWAANYLYAGKRSGLRFWVTLGQIMFAPEKLDWPIPERAAGTNFTWPLLTLAKTAGLRVFLIGKLTPGQIQSTARVIENKLPGIQIVGTLAGRDLGSKYGQVSDSWLGQTAAAVTSASPDLILVGMGFPLQEQVCAYLRAHVPHGVFIGEGGTFDYDSFGGAYKKAPGAIQRAGLEWFWRLLTDPRRIVRQLAIPRFIFRVYKLRRS